jgi:NAD+ synthase
MPIRDWENETRKRVQWVQSILSEVNANGVILGLSGGKDSSIVAVLCRMATENVLGVMMPCENNLPKDKSHALLLAEKFNIVTIDVNLSMPFFVLEKTIQLAEENDIDSIVNISDMPRANMKPRLRMVTLYMMGQSRGYLVAGTCNCSEAIMGYFTKWGDEVCDFNVISDLTVTELLEFGEYLGIPQEILKKQPSAGLWDGQTDEGEMGITYKAIDNFILNDVVEVDDLQIIKECYNNTKHKRIGIKNYCSMKEPFKEIIEM